MTVGRFIGFKFLGMCANAVTETDIIPGFVLQFFENDLESFAEFVMENHIAFQDYNTTEATLFCVLYCTIEVEDQADFTAA